MDFIYGRDDEIARWVGERLKIGEFGPKTTIGVTLKGEIVAGAVYHQYHWPGIAISLATSTPRWCTRQSLNVLLGYPFVQLECRRLTAVVESTNQQIIALVLRLGFQREGYHPDGFPSGDGLTFGLLRRDAAKWVEGL